MRQYVGFTTTIPVEVIFAAGLTPLDLNNVFVTDEDPQRFVERAERDGFPKSMCSWIKGIYGVVMEKGICTVITVMQGDCSNTQALSEILRFKGVDVIPFAYPFDRDRSVLKREIGKLMEAFRVEESRLREVERELERVRLILNEIDRLTWQEGVVHGEENHLWLVRASDMLGDFMAYAQSATSFLREVMKRGARRGVRLGYVGVPPIFCDLYREVEGMGGHVVYNETQRQFALPFFDTDIVERYLLYTYPYGIFARLEDIKAEIKKRRIQGVIHYVQAFCFRVMEDIILRDVLDVPMITIEGELPRRLDSRTKTRLEAFLEMLKDGRKQEVSD